ncbi:hypothetical protein EST38_g8571 [Candolleomyces aberdarensis]|uniref:Uncharacterized protein n=1 Tax=Candolleomyces aberdarensis TaxID=2316362 RepID=A0A4Q2DF22_9AGAR|nr:hypothetical protein EST38_g8571 [Candolleomyces aberdarensis]
MAPDRRDTWRNKGELPPDILRIIFATYRSMCREEDTYRSRDAQYDSEWMSVAFVSRSWRSIALDFAQLWCTIRVSKFTLQSVEFLQIQLKRTKSAPMDVELNLKNVKRLEDDQHVLLGWQLTRHLILEIVPRLRSLVLQGGAQYAGTFLQDLVHRAEHLESFIVESKCAIPSNIFAGGVPNLQYLALDGCQNVPWDTALFRSGCLSELTIRHTADQSTGEEISLPQSHDKLLPLAGRLTSLCLSSVLKDYERVVRLSNNSTLHLPSLKSLHIDASSTTVASFLRSIRIPTTTTVCGHVTLRQCSMDDVQYQFSSVIHSLTQARSSHPVKLTHLLIYSVNSTSRGILPYSITGWAKGEGEAPRYYPYQITPSNIEPMIDFDFEWADGHGPEGGWCSRDSHPFCLSDLGFDLSQLVSLDMAAFHGTLEVVEGFWKEIAALPRLSMLATQGFDLLYFIHCIKMDSLAIEMKQAADPVDHPLPDTAKEYSGEDEEGSTTTSSRHFTALKFLMFNNAFPSHHIPPSGELWDHLEVHIGDSDDEGEGVWRIKEETMLRVQKAHELAQNLLKNVRLRREIGSPLESIDFSQHSSAIVTPGMAEAFKVFLKEINGRKWISPIVVRYLSL